jgi:hypothetical protein
MVTEKVQFTNCRFACERKETLIEQMIMIRTNLSQS